MNKEAMIKNSRGNSLTIQIAFNRLFLKRRKQKKLVFTTTQKRAVLLRRISRRRKREKKVNHLTR